MSKLIVTAVGPATSVQDSGRYGQQRYGLTPSGAMDRFALAVANSLVGNPITTAAIEIGPFGATFTAQEGPIRLALSGARRSIKLNEHEVPPDQSVTLGAGDRLILGTAREGVFSYLAIEHGVQGEPTFGSLSVNARAGLGSPYQRPLQAGDQLDTLPATASPERAIILPPPPTGSIRVILGPQDDEFGDAARLFLDSAWKISATSDRMGYRLEGPVIRHLHGHNIVSDGTVNGSIQVPGSGQPIVLMPDRGTSGGYPKIATVISADLGRFAQTPPGREFRFQAIDLAEARNEAIAFLDRLAKLPEQITHVANFDLDIAVLQNANVAGVAINAFDAGTWETGPSGEFQP